MKLPVPIEQIIESDFNLAIIPIPGLQKDFDIDGFLAANMKEISIDEYAYMRKPRRARFTIAHELSHLLLHESIYQANIFNTIEQYKNFTTGIGEDDYRWLEWQARCLAGLLLVPKKQLTEHFSIAVGKAREHNLNADSEPAIDYICDWVSDIFEVSKQVIQYRLYKDGHINIEFPPSDS